MRLIQYRLHKLAKKKESAWLSHQPTYTPVGLCALQRLSQDRLTNFFMSPCPSLTPTRFRTIRPMRSSLQTTTSMPKYFIRTGLLTNRARGKREASRDVKLVGIGGRGNVADDHGSNGPGTNTQCEVCNNGMDRIKSVRALKPSAKPTSQLVWLIIRHLQGSHALVYRLRPPSPSQPLCVKLPHSTKHMGRYSTAEAYPSNSLRSAGMVFG